MPIDNFFQRIHTSSVIVGARGKGSVNSSEMTERVRQLLERVRQKTEGDADLVARIAPLVGRRYKPSSVSNWRRGHDRMPAEALLAACQVTGVSIDEVLFGESLVGRQDRLEKELAELRKSVETRPLLAGVLPPEP
jgi:hypothetical protein